VSRLGVGELKGDEWVLRCHLAGGLKYDPLGWRREEWSRRKMWHFADRAATWFFSFSLDQ
jgi:hypothetical protein